MRLNICCIKMTFITWFSKFQHVNMTHILLFVRVIRKDIFTTLWRQLPRRFPIGCPDTKRKIQTNSQSKKGGYAAAQLRTRHYKQATSVAVWRFFTSGLMKLGYTKLLCVWTLPRWTSFKYMHSDINVPALPETVPENHLSGSPLMLRSSPTVVFRNHGSG